MTSRRIIPNPAYRDAPWEELIVLGKDVEAHMVKTDPQAKLNIDLVNDRPRRWATREEALDPDAPSIPQYIETTDP